MLRRVDCSPAPAVDQAAFRYGPKCRGQAEMTPVAVALYQY